MHLFNQLNFVFQLLNWKMSQPFQLVPCKRIKVITVSIIIFVNYSTAYCKIVNSQQAETISIKPNLFDVLQQFFYWSLLFPPSLFYIIIIIPLLLYLFLLSDSINHGNEPTLYCNRVKVRKNETSSRTTTKKYKETKIHNVHEIFGHCLDAVHMLGLFMCI